MSLPLENITVVSLEQAVSAPFATVHLADAGARVIKVERPGGDFARGYDDSANGLASYFVWLNRGKESRVLDLTTPEGKSALSELIAQADVVVQNLKPGALARLGFAQDQLVHDHPHLIILSISGYGEGGPMAQRKAYDMLIQAESGLSSVTGSAAEPSRVGISVADIATGMTAYAAILEALIARGKTGKGAQITVSMFDVMADWLTVPLLNHEGGKSPTRAGLSHPSIAPYGVFSCIDDSQVLISIQSNREWAQFARVFLQQPELISDPRFETNVARVAHRAETDKVVKHAFAIRTHDEAIADLTEADVAFASVNDMEALSHHPHLRRITVNTPNGPVSYPAPAPVFIDDERHYRSVPGLGEGTC